MSFNALGKIVWDRKLAFLTVFILIVAGVTAFTMTVTPLYQSEALLMTTLDRAQRQQSQFPDTLRYQLNSQIYIINSEDVLRQAISEFGAARLFPDQKQPAAWRTVIPPEWIDRVSKITAPFWRERSDDARTDADRALSKVKKRLAVTLEKDSQILSLTFRHEDPKVAEQFLTLVVRDFLQRQADLSGNAAAPAFFRQQASRYLDEYKRASAELSAFAAQHSTYSVGQEIELALARRDNATAALEKTRGAIAEKEAQAATFQNTLTQLRRRISLPSEITGPKQNVPGGNSDALTDSNKVPANESPLLLVRVFQETAQSLVNLNSEIVGLRSLEKAQTESVADVGRKLSELSSIAAEFNRLKDQLDQVSKVMEAHVGRAAEAQLNADWDASEKLSNVKIAQSATSPTEPVFPPKPLFLALGGVIGLVGGAATCVMLEAIRVRRRRAWERRLYAEREERFDDDIDAEQGGWSPSPAMADYRLRRQAPLA
uniref:GumC family protein n=1 Tax=Bradyrhizobium sp. (strain ORS 278) TaxID=114615 RepID=UPI000305D42E|nr:Wzz/FepE/Etk N-terminal domain-containing protein [Bradyrhizobium sp. ORS 278]